ncbi:MAG TPA: cytochrome P450 [Mycobacteriales bacterium]|jgi:cytochrome P450|nr:cytochrome P450 [Mycobacteriales bacterium]
MSEAVDFESVDFFRDDRLIGDPYPYFDHLRAKCPVQAEPHHNVVMVTGYDEACEIYGDSDTFSSCLSVSGPFPGFPVPLVGDDVSDLIEKHRDELPMSDQLPTMDPPKHRDHRGLLMRLLTPARLRENESAMTAMADRQIDAFIESGSCELISDFANPFTFFVIANLLGVPEEDQAEIHEGFKGRKGTVGSTSKTMGHSPLEYLYDLLSTYVEDRRKHPRADVMTGMAQATFEDGTLPEVIDVVRVAANLFAAGQETTVRLLGTSFQLIGERPELQELLRGDPAAIPNFVEECLRYESPVKGDFRLARVSTKVGGVRIPAGTIVMVVNGAANHDARKFSAPKEFQPDRSNARQHLAFGRGIHTCPGGPLARAEGRVSLERILARADDIRISEAHHGPATARRYDYVPTYILRGLRELHLEFTPKG